MYSMNETIAKVRDLGIVKVNKKFVEKMVLGMIAGASVAFGYITYFKVLDQIEGGLGLVIGASLFPIGLLIVLMAGGELLTGNMMVVGTSKLHQDVSMKDLLINWFHITLGNLIGASFVALVFVMYLETISPDSIHIQNAIIAKMSETPMQMIVSGIGCNIFVGLSVWMYLGSKDGFLKFIAIWFPITIFVILGFQHVVANMFLLMIGLMQDTISITQYLGNISFVFIGNALGGVFFVGLLYALASGSLKD